MSRTEAVAVEWYGEVPPPLTDADSPTEGNVAPVSPLRFVTAAEHAAYVDSLPPPRWLARPVWPEDAYGVIGAEQKAGKTWAVLDLVVSVASGTPWLGAYAIERSGPVVVFLGEGGQRKMLRRLRAVCAAKGIDYERLPIHLCFRVPTLSSVFHIESIERKVRSLPELALVVVDPLYLAAKGAKSSSVYDMGAHLEPIQLVCQDAGSALVVVHHWNKGGEGSGVGRFTGAGSAEWGRVLVSAAVVTKQTDRHTRSSAVTLELHFEGDEIPDTAQRFRRTVAATDPDSLESPLTYKVEPLEDDAAQDARTSGLRPAARRVLVAIEGAQGAWLDVRTIGDRLADSGFPLKARTIQDACKSLTELGLLRTDEVPGTNARRWRAQAAEMEGANGV